MRFEKMFLIFILVFLAGAFGAEIVMAQISTGSASFVRTQRTDLRQYYGDRLSTYYPILAESDSCFARQDIILQVSPAGCQPAVVRSDLLAEQNVPVFCQIDSLKLNPILDIDSIRNIRFAGDYPPEVAGVGFHPARAALRTRDRLLGAPLLNNIGYAVIVLKGNPNEESIPDFVNLTLNARLEYESGNALGIGKTEFLLKRVTEDEWASERIRQSFFRGQYSVRLIDAEPNFAIVEIYKGDVKIATLRVEKGRAAEIFVPGGYCQVSLFVHYDGFVAPEKIARLRVDDDAIDVYKGSRFLDNKCQVLDIKGGDVESSVELRCGNERFTLGIKPKILERGDVVILTNESDNEDAELWEILEFKEGKYVISKISEGKNLTVENFEIIPKDTKVLFEAEYSGDAEVAFKKSIEEYQRVADELPFEKPTGDKNEDYIGETALYNAIALSEKMSKEQTEALLINKFLEIYPDSAHTGELLYKLNRLYAKDSSAAGTSVEIDNKIVSIKMTELISPTKKQTARFIIDNAPRDIGVSESINFTGIGGKSGSLTVEIIESERVRVSGSCGGSNNFEEGGLNLKWMILGTDSATATVCGKAIKLDSIELEEYAKVRIEPSVKNMQTDTNFTVNIGIEKRAIKLNPEKAQEKIDNLDETIKKWESISNNLGNVVTGLKTACFATAGVLTVKNFFAGLSGEALARQEVMRRPGGWTDKCKELVSNGEYSTLTECYNAKASEINQDVTSQAKAISLVNDGLKPIENANTITASGFFGGKNVNREKASQELITKIARECSNINVNIDGTPTSISGILNAGRNNSLSYEQLRDIYRDCLILKGSAGDISQTTFERVRLSLDNLGRQAYERGQEVQVISSYSEALKDTAFKDVASYGDKDQITGEYRGAKRVKNGDFELSGLEGEKDAEIIVYKSRPYLIILDRTSGGNYVTSEAYYLEKQNGNLLVNSADKEVATAEIKDRFNYFKLIDASSYSNAFAQGEARQVKYYETEPYKGMPAFVPFDLDNGWYVATKQVLPGFGNIKSFEASGRPVSFWICNIGNNKKPDFFLGVSDDICRQFNLQTGQSLDKFPGLSEQQTRVLVDKAINALNQAAEQHGKKQVVIEGKKFDVGTPAVNIPGTQCQDFMSPGDCKLLFNVCDPVICPSSRCDLGGAYPVADVIQTGIVGSALLCLPNAKEGIVLPVCLTGIKAGIDGYVSILKSHQACLQENIDTGRTIGICDQIYSVYACEFFWRQAAPVANILLPKVVEFAYSGGQAGARGGGEYLTVQSSWDNAQKSANFFTQDYAVNALDAFRIRSVEEAGTPFCKAFISAKGPKSFKTLVEPDSPPQFHAFFSEIPFSDATFPATSQYKVFYHIFAGNDAGVQFSVYLRDPPALSYYANIPIIVVATGFAPRGGFATETRDFTAPAGYKELCVRINDKEECGFKQVSTSFALNTMRDSFIKGQIEKADITSESECISGSLNPSLLLTPNIQEAAQEAIDPAIYNRGVVRICSTHNPGEKTDETRFLEVGFCDTPEIKCWLDKDSVDKAMSRNIPLDKGIKDETLSELNERQKQILESTGKIYSEIEAREVIGGLEEEVNEFEGTTIKDAEELEAKIKAEEDKLFFNNFRARIYLLVGQVYEKVALALQPKVEVTKPATEKEIAKDANKINNSSGESGDGGGGDEKVEEIKLSIKKGIYLWQENNNVLHKNGESLNIVFIDGRILVLAKDGSKSIHVGNYNVTKNTISINGLDGIRPEGFSLGLFNRKNVVAEDDYDALELLANGRYNYSDLLAPNYYKIQNNTIYLGNENLGIILQTQLSGSIRLLLQSNNLIVLGIYANNSETGQLGDLRIINPIPLPASHLTEHLEILEGQSYEDLAAGNKITGPTLGGISGTE